MADYYWATFEIPKGYETPQLVALLEQDSDDPGSLQEDLFANGKVIRYSNSARWGQFESAEIYCKDNKIPFNTNKEGADEGNDYIEYYRPGTKQELRTFDATATGDHFVEAKHILELTNLLYEEQLSREETIQALTGLLNTYCASNVTKLETFAKED